MGSMTDPQFESQFELADCTAAFPWCEDSAWPGDCREVVQMGGDSQARLKAEKKR